MKRLLFVHQNFPGQYRHLAAHYAAEAGYRVVAVGEKANLMRQPRLPGVEVLGYDLPELKDVDPFNGAVVKAIHRGKRVYALWLPDKPPSPFFTRYCTKWFRDETTFFDYLDRSVLHNASPAEHETAASSNGRANGKSKRRAGVESKAAGA